MKNMNLDECDENKAQAADDTNCSSDSDNQSIISIADTNTSICSGSSDEFVVVPTVENNEVEEKKEVKVEETNEEVKAGGSDDNNNSANDENDTAKKLIDVVKKEDNKSGKLNVKIKMLFKRKKQICSIRKIVYINFVNNVSIILLGDFNIRVAQVLLKTYFLCY